MTKDCPNANGDWNAMLRSLSSSTADRLHQRGALYGVARDEMEFGNIETAVQRFTEANCEKFDVPRLLLQRNPGALHSYVDSRSDRRLFTWYAQFLECQNDVEGAMEYYRRAEDLKSVVRMLNQTERGDEALELVRSSKNEAAAFQLAHMRETEEDADPELLVDLYNMQYEMDDRIVMIASRSEKPQIIMAAKYLERKGLTDKAISLYHKAGQISKAAELAFDQGYYANIETISDDITMDSDPELIRRCVDYFAENNQADRAVALLTRANKVDEAVALCVRYQVKIDESLIEAVLESGTGDQVGVEQRASMIVKLSDRCLADGLYHEAARLFLEAGKPEDSMNALAKTGDIDAITRYIRIIRDPDALIIAGNNLQSHPWHQKRQIFDAIVLAYKRAGAHLYLASFYDSWGETACESGHYEIAAEAFKKSSEVLTAINPSGNVGEIDAAREEVEIKRKVVDYFLDVKKEAGNNSEEAHGAAEQLLQHTKWESGVRTGHVYALLVTINLDRKKMNKCRRYLQMLKDECPKMLGISDFIDEDTLSRIA